jgi:hypothetical protein
MNLWQIKKNSFSRLTMDIHSKGKVFEKVKVDGYIDEILKEL